MTLRTCRACSAIFRGAHWERVCSECITTTTPAEKSQHPVLKYEREHKEQPIIPANPAYVEEQLAELKRLTEVVGTENDVEQKSVPRQIDCEHEFKQCVHATTCIHCDIFQHQFFDSVDLYVKQRGLA